LQKGHSNFDMPFIVILDETPQFIWRYHLFRIDFLLTLKGIMGSNSSKLPPHDDVRDKNLEQSTAPSITKADASDDLKSQITVSPTESSGCPMKRSDGSYNMDWGAMFRPNFPHKPNGSTPLTKEQAKEATNKTTNTNVAGIAGTEANGCPIKASSNWNEKVEFDVYSRPIVNPSNNMPHNPNQLPAATQSVSLSTDRVSSSIPKVSCIGIIMTS
jgi:Cytochrome c/c1 heme lyase